MPLPAYPLSTRTTQPGPFQPWDFSALFLPSLICILGTTSITMSRGLQWPNRILHLATLPQALHKAGSLDLFKTFLGPWPGTLWGFRTILD